MPRVSCTCVLANSSVNVVTTVRLITFYFVNSAALASVCCQEALLVNAHNWGRERGKSSGWLRIVNNIPNTTSAHGWYKRASKTTGHITSASTKKYIEGYTKEKQ